MAKIMYVDYDKMMSDLFTDGLRRRGHEVEFYSSIDTAVVAFKRQPMAFEVVILDPMTRPGDCYMEKWIETKRPTGLFLRDDIRAQNKTAHIVFFCHFDSLMPESLEGADDRQHWMSKKDYGPTSLADAIDHFLAQA